jgi:hypothetical protein
MTKVVADFPALVVYDAGADEIMNVPAPRETVFVFAEKTRNHGTLYPRHLASSVALYARQYGEDEAAAVERAKANGHEIHFFIALGAMLTAERQAKVSAILLEPGRKIRLDGEVLEVFSKGRGYYGLRPV